MNTGVEELEEVTEFGFFSDAAQPRLEVWFVLDAGRATMNSVTSSISSNSLFEFLRLRRLAL
jgi:hypothetical protein